MIVCFEWNNFIFSSLVFCRYPVALKRAEKSTVQRDVFPGSSCVGTLCLELRVCSFRTHSCRAYSLRTLWNSGICHQRQEALKKKVQLTFFVETFKKWNGEKTNICHYFSKIKLTKKKIEFYLQIRISNVFRIFPVVFKSHIGLVLQKLNYRFL